jgi:protein-S-isoprenylcysteine O-methyltransferase Ste14
MRRLHACAMAFNSAACLAAAGVAQHARCAWVMVGAALSCARWGLCAGRRVAAADTVANALLLAPLAAAALAAAASTDQPPAATDAAAAALFALSGLLSLVGRAQLARHAWTRGGLCTTGLRAVVRHPQHLAEALCWLALWLPAASGELAALAALVPAVAGVDALFVGVPAAERRLAHLHGSGAVRAWRAAVPRALGPWT